MRKITFQTYTYVYFLLVIGYSSFEREIKRDGRRVIVISPLIALGACIITRRVIVNFYADTANASTKKYEL